MLTLPSTASICARDINSILLARYVQVLDIHELVRLAQEEKHGKLSGLFLPEVNEAYLQSKARVMLVGQETTGWRHGLQTLAAKDRTQQTLRAYVDGQMAVYRGFFSRPPGRSIFRQFHGKLHASLGDMVAADRNAVFWANLFCVSLNGRSPLKASELSAIAEMSRALLKIQFEVLRPDIVVFATGHRYDRFLKKQVGAYTALPGLRPGHYWPFEVHGPAFKAWRVRHPRRLTRDVKHELLRAIRACAATTAASEPSSTED